MASFNQSPLGQTTIVASFSDHVTGSAAPSAPVRANLTAARATGNLGQPTQYLQLVNIQPSWRRESKLIGS